MANEIKESVALSLDQTGFAKGEAELRAFEGAERRAAAGAELLARAQTVVERSTTRLGSRMAAFARSEMTEAERVLKRLADGQALVEQAQRRGLPVPDQIATTVARLNERYERLQGASKGAAGAMALTRMEALTLTYTFNDVVASLASGGSLFTIVAQQGGQLTQGFGGVRQTFEKLLPLIARYIAIGGAAATVAAAFYEVISTYGEIRKINEGAQAAGVSTDLFQIWLKHATALRLEAKAAEDAILHAGKTLAGQVDNFSALDLDGGQSKIAQRANSLSEVLGRDVRSKELAAEATTLDDMHRAALQLVKDYFDAAEQLDAQGRSLDANEARTQALLSATEVWGDAGRKVAAGIRDGTLNLDEFAKMSSKAGVIWGQDILDAQEKVSKELATADEHLGNATTKSETFAKIALSTVSAWAGVVEKVAELVGWMDKLLVSAGDFVEKITLGQIKNDLRRVVSLEDVQGRRVQLDDMIIENRSIAAIPLPPNRPKGLGEAPPREKKPKAERSDEVERYVDGLRKSVEVLQAEADAQGKSNVQREKAIDLAKAEEEAKKRGTALTAQEIKNIEMLAERRVTLNKKIEDAREAKRGVDEQTRFFGEQSLTAIESAISSAQRLDQVMQNVARSITTAALRAALLGDGPLASLFGTKGKDGGVGGLFGLFSGAGLGEKVSSGLKGLFAGLFADGGTIPAGRFGIVGERGPELAFAGSSPVNIVPAFTSSVASRLSAGPGGAAPVYMNFHNAPPLAQRRESRAPSGGRRFEFVFADQVAATARTPAVRQALFGQGAIRPT